MSTKNVFSSEFVFSNTFFTAMKSFNVLSLIDRRAKDAANVADGTQEFRSGRSEARTGFVFGAKTENGGTIERFDIFDVTSNLYGMTPQDRRDRSIELGAANVKIVDPMNSADTSFFSEIA